MNCSQGTLSGILVLWMGGPKSKDEQLLENDVRFLSGSLRVSIRGEAG